MKQLVMLSVILLLGSFLASAQHFDTVTTIRKVYHLQLPDGTKVDSVVEVAVIKKPALPQIPRVYDPLFSWDLESRKISESSVSESPFVHGNYLNRHPELKCNETFLVNISKSKMKELPEYLKGYKTLRIGKVAYNRQNEKIDANVPVFITTEEFNSLFQ